MSYLDVVAAGVFTLLFAVAIRYFKGRIQVVLDDQQYVTEFVPWKKVGQYLTCTLMSFYVAVSAIFISLVRRIESLDNVFDSPALAAVVVGGLALVAVLPAYACIRLENRLETKYRNTSREQTQERAWGNEPHLTS